jgi:alpha/beta superfamily hydrolase
MVAAVSPRMRSSSLGGPSVRDDARFSPSTNAVEEAMWFGPTGHELFGVLTLPTGTLARGGVLLAPPFGMEGHPARRALRALARSLAAAGYVSLRFDYDGTGDSRGGLEDPERDRAWVASVVEAAKLLRSLGLTTISAVGMRLGATLVGAAARDNVLDLASVVLWDPCETGRSFLRELRAFEALRRDDTETDSNGVIETSEFVLSAQTAAELRSLSLSNPGQDPPAARTLVVARDDRVIPEKLRTGLGELTEWVTTSEQAGLLDVDPLVAVMPSQTISRIVEWLSRTSPTEQEPIRSITSPSPCDLDLGAVRERIVQLGPRGLFGIVCEPTGEVQGPLIVLLNVSMGDHTGPARLWVDLSRRWAKLGLQCLRFDLSGLGDSPWNVGESDAVMFDRRWNEDVAAVVRDQRKDDASNAVLVGLCSGAFLAIEGAWSLRALGVCAINPPIGLDLLYASSRMGRSRRGIVRAVAAHLNVLSLRLRWVAAAAWEICRMLLPSSYALDLASAVADNGTDLLVLATTEDVSPYSHVPVLRSVDRRRWSPRNFKVEFVDGLDHSMHRARGRDHAVEALDRYVTKHIGVTSQAQELGRNGPTGQTPS